MLVELSDAQRNLLLDCLTDPLWQHTTKAVDIDTLCEHILAAQETVYVLYDYDFQRIVMSGNVYHDYAAALEDADMWKNVIVRPFLTGGAPPDPEAEPREESDE